MALPENSEFVGGTKRRSWGVSRPFAMFAVAVLVVISGATVAAAAARTSSSPESARQLPSHGCSPQIRQSYITRKKADGVARSYSPLLADSTKSRPTWSKLTDYRQASTLLGDSGNPLLCQSTMVWVVTVHAPIMTDGGPSTPPKMRQSYTVVLNAADGRLIDSCVGCSSLSPRSG
jgi:hypothetical protein